MPLKQFPQTPPRAVWNSEKELLKALLDVCQRHHLRVWADGGTLLGAVRHKGFIPWDDDIDLCMPRDDYDKLIALADEFHEPFFLQSAYTDVDYYRGHAQLRNSHTAAIRPSDCFQPFNQGIFIDIFVIDGLPDNDQERRQLVRSTRRIMRLLKAKNVNILFSGRLGLLFRKIKCRREVTKRGWHSIFREMEQMLRRSPFDTSRHVAEVSFSGQDIVLRREVFAATVWLDFDGMKIPAPVGYDELLRTQYGDYMTPVREPNYHGELLFDVDRSYRELLPCPSGEAAPARESENTQAREAKKNPTTREKRGLRKRSKKKGGGRQRRKKKKGGVAKGERKKRGG